MAPRRLLTRCSLGHRLLARRLCELRLKKRLHYVTSLLLHLCVHWVSHEREWTQRASSWPLCQPGERLCVRLCYGCCSDFLVSQERQPYHSCYSSSSILVSFPRASCLANPVRIARATLRDKHELKSLLSFQ